MISRLRKLFFLGAILNLLLAVPLHAAPLTATVATPSPAESGYFKLGTTKNPAGHELSATSRSLLLDGQPWFPVMGEIHYSRVPQAEWREELLKMKAGGVDIVATYVFWIHHEEVQGQWDWTGQRDLKKFLQLCGELGFKVVVRLGPWCHGEVRNGGFPNWVQNSGWKLRSNDTNYLAAAETLYSEIAKQLRGQLWKDGGPVIGVQVENEFRGSPDHLMKLKRMAIEAGIDVPFYIKTGWPAMKSPVPLGELFPLFGAYADGFWERGTQPMPGNGWTKFTFSTTRTDTAVANDTLGNRKSGDTSGTDKYPYLTCEIGGGMPASYHRRMNYDPRDVTAVVLCQLGGGSSLMGYYMYHGGQNPEGKLSTLQESTATGYPNDLPVKSYDFNAPIGEFGQLNPQFFWLRRLHLFLRDFGAALSQMPTTLPDVLPANKADTNTLRWCVRSDGDAGYVFVNNYERLRALPAKTNVQFKLNLPGGEFIFPRQPVTIPSDAFFIWPFKLHMDCEVELDYATAQPVCLVTGDGGRRTWYFAAVEGVPAEFCFRRDELAVKTSSGTVRRENRRTVVADLKPGREAAIHITQQFGPPLDIVLLSEADSLTFQKTEGKIVFEKPPAFSAKTVHAEPVKSAGPPREIPMTSGKSPVAIAPTDADFASAAVWQIKLPAKQDLSANPLLRIRYAGDVARLTLNGKLIADNFYCGREFDLGLRRYGSEIFTGNLRLEILPLRKDAPIFIEPQHKPKFGTNDTVLTLQSAEVVAPAQ